MPENEVQNAENGFRKSQKFTMRKGWTENQTSQARCHACAWSISAACYGSQTTMVPYTVQRSDFLAIYFAKGQAKIGLFAVPLDDETRQKLETNSGIRVDLVIENTGAFNSDILPGDVLLKFNETQIRSVEQYQELITQFKGSQVSFTIVRNGKPITKVVPVNQF